MIKHAMVVERLTLIQDAATTLDSLTRISLDEFTADLRNPAAAESYLRRALETIFDVGRHLLAASGRVSMAAEYKGIAKGLGQLGIIDGDLASRLLQMAGYRNRLVHLYAQVAPQELYEIIKATTGDLRSFVRSIEVWLASRPQP